MKLGRKKDISIKEHYKTEKAFSKWLASDDGVEYLSEQIGVSLENPRLENSGNGKFPVDITFEFEIPDEDEPIVVCVENQFGATNHDHFSKLITYAANCDARYAVWIAEEVHPDHKNAVQYLNEHLDEKLRIFLLKASMMSIDDSNPILILDSVVEPEGGIVKPEAKGTLSELNVLQNRFWFSYKEKCNELKKENLARSKPYPQHWYDVRVGSSKYHITISTSAKRNQTIKVGLWIHDDIALFSKLYEQKEKIEAEFGRELDWQNKDEKKARHVWHVVIDDFDIYDESKWNDYFEKIITAVEEYRDIFYKYL